jgi:hypothetical protein
MLAYYLCSSRINMHRRSSISNRSWSGLDAGEPQFWAWTGSGEGLPVDLQAFLVGQKPGQLVTGRESCTNRSESRFQHAGHTSAGIGPPGRPRYSTACVDDSSGCKPVRG